jgi:hypothetical protein
LGTSRLKLLSAFWLPQTYYGTSHVISKDEAKFVFEKGCEQLVIGSGQKPCRAGLKCRGDFVWTGARSKSSKTSTNGMGPAINADYDVAADGVRERRRVSQKFAFVAIRISVGIPLIVDPRGLRDTGQNEVI